MKKKTKHAVREKLARKRMRNQAATTAKTARELYGGIYPPDPGTMFRVWKARHDLPVTEQQKILDDIEAYLPVMHAKGGTKGFLPRVVACDLKKFSKVITSAAEQQNREFFIRLGKCLSRPNSPLPYDELDFDIAKILMKNPAIGEKDALCELEKLNPKYKELKLGVFRNRKKRLRFTECMKIIGARPANATD
jgi:hypothetical protein